MKQIIATVFRFVTSAFILFISVGVFAQTSSQPDDPGYFLSCTQKGQLIWSGRIQDSTGNWYDIWIVPGYTDPAREMRINTIKAGKDFAEYGHKKKYSDLADASGDAFEWAFEDCLVDFAFKDSGKAWQENWSSAGKRTKQRVFGWWLAYPWALLQSTAETAVRVPVGAAGTVLGTAWGGAVVPVYYGVNSTVKGTVRFGVKAVALPASAMVWNTAASPVMALVGQKPAPERADGFWVKQLSEDELEMAIQSREPVSREELEALAQWGGVLVTASDSFSQKRQQLREQANRERSELNRKFREMEENLTEEERLALSKVAKDSDRQGIFDLLNESGYDARRVNYAAGELRRYLEQEGGFSRSEINHIIQLLRTYPPSSAR